MSYSKAEWGSLSIQERIRAMNKATNDDDSLSIAQDTVDSSFTTKEEQQQELPKRSSVVDIWRKRDGGGSGNSSFATTKKPAVRAPSPVSVPWPDEEEEEHAAATSSKPQLHAYSQSKPKPSSVTTPSWRSQLKSKSSRVVVASSEKKAESADLTILPSTSQDEQAANDEVAAVNSHSKSVMDLYTKRALVIPDSPITVETNDGDDSISVTTPKRSSVVDIWTKRTSSAEKPKPNVVSTKRSSFGSNVVAAASPPVSSTTLPTSTACATESTDTKKKESPLKAWNKRKSAVKQEEEPDLVIVQSESAEEAAPSKESSVVNRYKQLAQLRNVPKPTEESESLEKPTKSSSVVSAWGAQLRKVPRKSPSPVTTEPTVEDDDFTEESAVMEEQQPQQPNNKPSPSVVNRWKPQASGESPQLRKVSSGKVPSPVVMPKANDDGDIRSSIANRWNPQRNANSTPKPIVSTPSTEDADGETETIPEEPPKRSNVANRWNPQGATYASPPLPKKVPTPVVTTPPVVNAEGDGAVEATPKRYSVANRWNPQGKGPLASPQLRKVINKVATPVGGERAAPTSFDAPDDEEEEEQTPTIEPKRPAVANRWNPPQASTASPQLRKVSASVKVSPVVVDQPAKDSENENTESGEKEIPRSNNVMNRWNPKGSEPSGSGTMSKAATEPTSEPKKPSVLDRYKPQTSWTPPRSQPRKVPTQESSPIVAQDAPDVTEDTTTAEPSSAETPPPTVAKKPSVLDRYKPASNESKTDPIQHYVPRSASQAPKHSNEKPPIRSWKSQTKDVTPAVPTEVDSNAKDDEIFDAAVASSDVIEPTASLPFDESPTTKLFASIEMSKSSGSIEIALKSEGDKVYDATDADGFPVLSKEGVTLVDDNVVGASADGVPEKSTTATDDDSGEKEQPEEPEGEPEDPKPIASSTPRSKTMELFANRRKYQHVVKVQTVDAPTATKATSVEAPIPKPASSLKVTTPSTSDAADTARANNDTFQSGTSAFTASPTKAADTPKASNTRALPKRTKRPKSMKEFLNKHRLKTSRAMKSSDSVASRSTASVDSAGSSKKRAGGKRTDLSVKTTDLSVDTRSSLPPVEPKDESTLSEASQAKEENSSGGNADSKTDDKAETDTVVARAGEADDVHEDEPGRISIGSAATSTKPSGSETPTTPSIVASPSPRTRSLRDRRIGRHKQGIRTPKSRSKPVPQKKEDQSQDNRAPTEDASSIPSLKPVQERAKAFSQAPQAPSQNTTTRSLAVDRKSQQPVPAKVQNPNTRTVDRWAQQVGSRTHESPMKTQSTGPKSDAGASETLSFFSAASSGYSTTISGISVDGSVLSPTSSLSNRASRALVNRRRGISSAEKSRVLSSTIREQSSSRTEDEEDSGRAGRLEKSVSEEEPFFGKPTTVPENDIIRGPGLSGRYNTSSRFMDSVQNLMRGSAPNTSFDSGTTEGSSQIRSVGSTSDSEAWMSGRMRKSTSTLNRVPSDSTDGTSYQSVSVTTSATGRSKKGGELLTDYFVSESSANLEALKSAYEAVSLHQIAMDLTDEVSVATNVDLKKIASNLNDGVSAASSSLRSGLNNLNSGSSSASKRSPPRKLKVPKTANEVDEEVAIEVEYMDDCSDEEEEDGDLNSPVRSRESEDNAIDMPKKRETSLPAGEPSQERAADTRRAYV